MADTVKVNFLILNETKLKIKQIASETFLRSDAPVVDWAVDELFKKLHPAKDDGILVIPLGNSQDGAPLEENPALSSQIQLGYAQNAKNAPALENEP